MFVTNFAPFPSPSDLSYVLGLFHRAAPGSSLGVGQFLRHHNRQRYDVLRLLHRGHVNHAAAEGERTLRRDRRVRPNVKVNALNFFPHNSAFGIKKNTINGKRNLKPVPSSLIAGRGMGGI